MRVQWNHSDLSGCAPYGGVLAGLVAIHLILKLALGFSGIAPTRTLAGLIAQAIAGGVGGYLFHVISLKRKDDRSAHNLAT